MAITKCRGCRATDGVLWKSWLSEDCHDCVPGMYGSPQA
jgi:hypothetical protein